MLFTYNFEYTHARPTFALNKFTTSSLNGTNKTGYWDAEGVPMGIALGLKVEIPTHNINDVIDATIAVLKDPNAPVVLIPDHCQQVDIVDTNWKQICNAGLGTYRSRGRINISENEKG